MSDALAAGTHDTAIETVKAPTLKYQGTYCFKGNIKLEGIVPEFVKVIAAGDITVNDPPSPVVGETKRGRFLGSSESVNKDVCLISTGGKVVIHGSTGSRVNIYAKNGIEINGSAGLHNVYNCERDIVIQKVGKDILCNSGGNINIGGTELNGRDKAGWNDKITLNAAGEISCPDENGCNIFLTPHQSIQIAAPDIGDLESPYARAVREETARKAAETAEANTSRLTKILRRIKPSGTQQKS